MWRDNWHNFSKIITGCFRKNGVHPCRKESDSQLSWGNFGDRKGRNWILWSHKAMGGGRAPTPEIRHIFHPPPCHQWWSTIRSAGDAMLMSLSSPTSPHLWLCEGVHSPALAMDTSKNMTGCVSHCSCILITVMVGCLLFKLQHCKKWVLIAKQQWTEVSLTCMTSLETAERATFQTSAIWGIHRSPRARGLTYTKSTANCNTTK